MIVMRVFRYPLSSMIHSQAFEILNPAARGRVFKTGLPDGWKPVLE